MISIRKYLSQGVNRVEQNESSQASRLGEDTLCSLCSAVLESIGVYVFSDESASDAREKIGQLKDSLHPQLLPDESLEIQKAVCHLLARHHSSMREAATRTAVEMRHLAGILNEAVALVATGGERSVAGLKKIQAALLQTSKSSDLSGLRASLAKTIDLANEESVLQQAESARGLAALQTNVVETRQIIAQHPNQKLRGRPEAVRNISEGMQTLVPEHALYVIAFAFSNLNALVHRYGPDAVEDVIFRLIRERVQPLAPANSAYRWTPQSLVGVFQRPRDLARLRSEATELNRSPLVHRISLGNRIAVLTLSPSHLIAEGQTGVPEALIEEVDRFTGANA